MLEYKANSRNILATSPHFAIIMEEYTKMFKDSEGHVNAKKFYEEHILPRIPEYGLMNWYQFLRRLKDSAGIVSVAKIKQRIAAPVLTSVTPQEAVNNLQNTLKTSQEATTKGINTALNIGAKTLEDLLTNSQLLSPEKRADLLFKAMKAQDSRIHALGKIREDSREQEKFDRAFNSASFDD